MAVAAAIGVGGLDEGDEIPSSNNILEEHRLSKHLKKDKSRDTMGYANEIFTLEVVGEDLLVGLLKLLNCIKEKQ